MCPKVYQGFLGEFHLHAPGRGRAGLQASQGLCQLVGYLQCNVYQTVTSLSTEPKGLTELFLILKMTEEKPFFFFFKINKKLKKKLTKSLKKR